MIFASYLYVWNLRSNPNRGTNRHLSKCFIAEMKGAYLLPGSLQFPDGFSGKITVPFDFQPKFRIFWQMLSTQNFSLRKTTDA